MTRRPVLYDGPGRDPAYRSLPYTKDTPLEDSFPHDLGIAIAPWAGPGVVQILPWCEVMLHLPHLLENSPTARADVRAMLDMSAAPAPREPMDLPTAIDATLRALDGLRRLETRPPAEIVEVNMQREAALQHLVALPIPRPPALHAVRMWLATVARRQLFGERALPAYAFERQIDLHTATLRRLHTPEAAPAPAFPTLSP